MSWQGWKLWSTPSCQGEIGNMQPRFGSWADVGSDPDTPITVELCNLEQDCSPQASIHPMYTCCNHWLPPLIVLPYKICSWAHQNFFSSCSEKLPSIPWDHFIDLTNIQLRGTYTTINLRLPAQLFRVRNVFGATLKKIMLMVFLPAVGCHLPLGWSQGHLLQASQMGSPSIHFVPAQLKGRSHWMPNKVSSNESHVCLAIT